jgi:hypothetical protein
VRVYVREGLERACERFPPSLFDARKGARNMIF